LIVDHDGGALVLAFPGPAPVTTIGRLAAGGLSAGGFTAKRIDGGLR
jgi:hypothetical protein